MEDTHGIVKECKAGVADIRFGGFKICTGILHFATAAFICFVVVSHFIVEGVLEYINELSQNNNRPQGSGRVVPNTDPIPKHVREYVLRRAGNRCEDCHHHYNGTLHVHHIKPRAVGGSNHANNLIALCPNCHGIAHKQLRR